MKTGVGALTISTGDALGVGTLTIFEGVGAGVSVLIAGVCCGLGAGTLTTFGEGEFGIGVATIAGTGGVAVATLTGFAGVEIGVGVLAISDCNGVVSGVATGSGEPGFTSITDGLGLAVGFGAVPPNRNPPTIVRPITNAPPTIAAIRSPNFRLGGGVGAT